MAALWYTYHGSSPMAVFDTKFNTMLSIILCMSCSNFLGSVEPTRLTCATNICLLSELIHLPGHHCLPAQRGARRAVSAGGRARGRQ